MQCPKCNRPLVQKRVKDSDVVLQSCVQCKGFWLARGQMEQILSGAVKGLRIPPDSHFGTRNCPSCGTLMNTFYYPGTLVDVDMCASCMGIWVDAGELREIRIVRAAEKNAPLPEEGSQSSAVPGSLWASPASPADVPGAKGSIISAVNAALDWVISW